MKPVFTLEVTSPTGGEKVSITAAARRRLVSLRTVDEAGIKSDSLDVRLAAGPNAAGKTLDVPPTNWGIELSLGYDEAKHFIGAYTIDSTVFEGPPDVVAIRALAAKWMTAFKAPRSASYSDVILGDLVRTIAARYGYGAGVSAAFDAVTLAHVDQTEESDANLLTRLARAHDAVFKPVAGGLIFVPRAESKKASGKMMATVKATIGTNVLRWRYTAEDRGRYDAVEAVWRDLGAAEDKIVTVGEGDLVYRMRNPYPNEAAATAAAEARYHRFQTGKGTLTLTILGEPTARAECPITLSGFHRDVPTEWVATRVSHSLDSSGFRTEIEAELPKGTAA